MSHAATEAVTLSDHQRIAFRYASLLNLDRRSPTKHAVCVMFFIAPRVMCPLTKQGDSDAAYYEFHGARKSVHR
nr:MAG TPA: hypothetical protein [Caudoviricetes sp.]